MSTNTKIRWGWIKGMYIYTIIVAGGFGFGDYCRSGIDKINVSMASRRAHFFWYLR